MAAAAKRQRQLIVPHINLEQTVTRLRFARDETAALRRVLAARQIPVCLESGCRHQICLLGCFLVGGIWFGCVAFCSRFTFVCVFALRRLFIVKPG